MFEKLKANIIFEKLMGRHDIDEACKMVGPEDSWYDMADSLYQRYQRVFSVDAADYDRRDNIRAGKYPLLLTAGSLEGQEEVLAVIKERNPHPSTVLILPGCNHGNGMYKQTELYQNTIREFAEQYM